MAITLDPGMAKMLDEEQKLFDDFLRDLDVGEKDLASKAVAYIDSRARMFGAHLMRAGLTDRPFTIERNFESASAAEWSQVALSLEPELKERLDELTFEGIGEALPLPDACVDIFLSHGTMPGADRKEGEDVTSVSPYIVVAFDETMRVLKPGAEARLFPLTRAAFGEMLEWRTAIVEQLERLRGMGHEVSVNEAARTKGPDGVEVIHDRIILRKR